jgi:hypothetical protein
VVYRYWPTVAEYAYRQFTKLGRGAVLLDWVEVVRASREPIDAHPWSIPQAYVPQALAPGAAPVLDLGYLLGRENAVLAEPANNYEPESQVLVLVMEATQRSGDHVRLFGRGLPLTIGMPEGGLSPKAAATRRGGEDG